MSEALTLARPYARAAFEVARAHDALAAWSGALALAGGVAADPRTHRLLSDPRISHDELVALHLPPDEQADGAFARFLGELARFRRLGLLPEIQAMFDALKRESESTLKVKVTSALALEPDEADKLKASLARRFGRNIDMEVHVDASLLGGVVIDAGNEVIDGSVRARLQSLQAALTH